MLVGPLFTREAVTSPRRARHHLVRSGYAVILFVLFWTAWQELMGGQRVVNLGEVSRFGFLLFQILALVQLVTVLFLAPLSVAGSVAQEKDRRTLVLLLMTDLSNHELVLGKLLAGLLSVGTMLLAALPVFALCLLLGGVSWSQVLGAFVVTASAALALGSLGVTIAFWRDKTFQTLALVLLAVVLYLVVAEGLPYVVPQAHALGMEVEEWSAALSPRKALLSVLEGDPLRASANALPLIDQPSIRFAGLMLLASLSLVGVSIARVRVWNPSGESGTPREGAEQTPTVSGSASAAAEPFAALAAATPPSPSYPGGAGGETSADEESAEPSTVAQLLRGRKVAPAALGARTRPVWSNPIIWREMRTRAYGRRPILIKAGYVILFVLMCLYLTTAGTGATENRLLSVSAMSLVVLGVVSLLLINAQAAVSVSTERDSRCLELLLVTDITPKEFVYGKLGGALYNCKELLLLPLGLVGFFWFRAEITTEVLAYVVLGLLVLYGFAAMLGVHSGLTFSNSRLAIANSLGTVFFLFVGMFICINLIVAAGPKFERGMLSFLFFILGGGIGLFASLGAKNPSRAIFLAAMACPFLTFYAIINFRQQYTLGVFLVIGAAYGWAIASMLIPAIHEFDVALGRTTREEG